MALAPVAEAQEDPTNHAEGMEAGTAVIDIDVDVATANSGAITGTLEELQANVVSELQQLDAAETAVITAEADLDAANTAIEATEAEITRLTGESDAVVVEAFINPPNGDAIAAYATTDIGDATVKQAFLDMDADASADVLADLEDAQQRLEELKQTQDDAAGEAEDRAADAEEALDDLEAATSQAADFVALVEERLNSQLSEAAALAALDPELAAQLAAEQAELVAKLQEISDTEAYREAMEALAEAERQRQEEAARAPVTLGPASGSLATVACLGGQGEITVDSSLDGPLTSMLAAASADGINLCGGGYRSYEDQVAARRANCGPSNYEIYQAPASSCSPPTAKPGFSEHEVGLAVDFECNGNGIITSSSSPCFQWLDANAARYGLYNLPSERWHWSTTGN